MTLPTKPKIDGPARAAGTRPHGFARALKKAAKVAVIGAGCLVVVLAVAGLLSKDRIEIPQNYLGKYINIKGEQIRYYQTGTGPDILLIHGLPGLIEDWQPIFDAAGKNYRLTAFDRPGHGFSSKPGEYSLEHNADVALSLIDQLQLKDVIVVGHSFGGAVVLAMAVRNPEKVKGFISLAGVTTHHDAGLTVLDLNRLPFIGRGLAVIGCYAVGEGMVMEGSRRVFSPNDTLLTKEFVDLRTPVFLQAKVAMTLSREAAAFKNDLETIEPRFSTITKPLHFVHGDKDQLIPVAATARFHERFPSTGFTVLKDTGHAIMSAQPEVVVSVIDSLNR